MITDDLLGRDLPWLMDQTSQPAKYTCPGRDPVDVRLTVEPTPAALHADDHGQILAQDARLHGSLDELRTALSRAVGGPREPRVNDIIEIDRGANAGRYVVVTPTLQYGMVILNCRREERITTSAKGARP